MSWVYFVYLTYGARLTRLGKSTWSPNSVLSACQLKYVCVHCRMWGTVISSFLTIRNSFINVKVIEPTYSACTVLETTQQVKKCFTENVL